MPGSFSCGNMSIAVCVRVFEEEGKRGWVVYLFEGQRRRHIDAHACMHAREGASMRGMSFLISSGLVLWPGRQD